MTNEQSAEDGAAPTETLSETEGRAEPLDNARRITFEKLRQELADEPAIERLAQTPSAPASPSAL